MKKRFPSIDHVIEAGLMRSDELKCKFLNIHFHEINIFFKEINFCLQFETGMDSLNEKCNVNKWWMPLVWATNIVNRARQENRLKSDPGMQTVLQEISNIRHGLTSVQHFDTLSVPLVYTQVCPMNFILLVLNFG